MSTSTVIGDVRLLEGYSDKFIEGKFDILAHDEGAGGYAFILGAGSGAIYYLDISRSVIGELQEIPKSVTFRWSKEKLMVGPFRNLSTNRSLVLRANQANQNGILRKFTDPNDHDVRNVLAWNKPYAVGFAFEHFGNKYLILNTHTYGYALLETSPELTADTDSWERAVNHENIRFQIRTGDSGKPQEFLY